MKFFLSVREFGIILFGSLAQFRSGVWRKITHFLIKSNKMIQNKENAISNGLWMVGKMATEIRH